MFSFIKKGITNQNYPLFICNIILHKTVEVYIVLSEDGNRLSWIEDCKYK